MDNISDSNKTAKLFTNESTGIKSDNGPYIGVVMDNRDPTRSGRISVWLKTHSGDKADPNNWRTVSYLSPFYGSTPFQYNDETPSEFDKNSHSYGMWFTSPDVGVEVLCFFVDGNPNSGYYVGYVIQPQMNHMIPATGARTTNTKTAPQEAALSEAGQLPVVEMTQSTENHNNADFYNVEKPVHSVLASQLWQQGTVTDKIRGPIGTSVQRESPSYAYGISTPGRPIYSGGFHEDGAKEAAVSGEMTEENTKVEGRRGGHSFSMDDGDISGNDVLMRLRTATGHQITMSDDGGCIYIQHANGSTWLEFGNDGTIDMYAGNSINLRTNGELNFHADKNINFYSGQNINMFAKENIKLESDLNFDIIGKKKVQTYSEEMVLVKSDGILSIHSATNTTILAGGDLIETGTLIQLNTSKADSVQKPEYITPTKLPDTENSDATGWKSVDAKLDSIVTRAPTHEPYAEHNKGVPVPVVLGSPVVPAPAPAPPATQEKIAATATAPPPEVPVQVADVASTANNDINFSEISNMTKATVASAIAQQAQIVNQAVNEFSEKGLGSLGIQPKMLEDLEIIKPGIMNIAMSSVDGVFQKLADPALFTGILGINSIDDLLNSENLQAKVMQMGMSQANELLQQSGILTGVESALETASILSTAMVATPAQIEAWVTGQATSAVSGIVAQGEAIVNNAVGEVNAVVDQLDNVMTEVSRASQYAVNLAEGAGADVINSITASASKAGGLAIVGNITRTAVDTAVNNIVGNIKIPSAIDVTLKLEESITSGLQSSITSLTSEVTNKIDDVINTGIQTIGTSIS